jgi:DNA polymerase-4
VSKDGYEQASLFPDEERERARKMDKAIDGIRSKFGMDAIARGSSVQSVEVGKKYKAQMENKNEKEK